jgi:drug/metabolite transporter (DMT)-like permease
MLWGLSFPAMKALVQTQQCLLPEVGSWFLTALCVTYRFGLAGLLLLPFAFRQFRSIRWREIEQGLVIGLFGGSGILSQMNGLAYTSASTSAFLTQGYCIFIPVWVALASRRWPTLKIFLSIALVVSGVIVLAEINLSSFKLGRGEIETLIASLMFTGQILTLENSRYAENRPLCLTLVMFLATAVLATPIAWFTSPSVSAWWQVYASPAADGFLAIIVLFCTLAAFIIMNTWQKWVSATEAGLIYCAEPVFASVMALFLPEIFSRWAGINYPNENLTLRLIVGGGLITLANVLLQSRWLEQCGAKD